MNKPLGFVLVLLGVVLTLKLLFSGWLLFLLIALGFALAAASGSIGRWGYGVAIVAALLALPSLLWATVISSLSLMFRLFRLLPILLILIGIWVLLKPRR